MEIALVLVKRGAIDVLQSGSAERHVLAVGKAGGTGEAVIKAIAKAGFRYELIDTDTGKSVPGQRLVRRGKSLEVYLHRDQVLELQDFYEHAAEVGEPAQYLMEDDNAPGILRTVGGGNIGPSVTPLESWAGPVSEPSTVSGLGLDVLAQVDEGVVALGPLVWAGAPFTNALVVTGALVVGGGSGGASGLAGPVGVVVPVLRINTVAGNDLVNSAKRAAGVMVSGTTDAEAGQMVSVIWGASMKRVAVGSDGRWQVEFNTSEVPADTARSVITAKVSDQTGTVSSDATHALIIDTTPPFAIRYRT